MKTDRLLTEIERQKKYLDELPEGFEFPLFNSRQAMESQRRNGYRNTASAAREIVDNAIEAGATKIHIVLQRGTGNDKKHESVGGVAFIDNGSGMLEKMARYALCLGGGTHFDDPAFIGKFGFGLPNSSINQTRRVEVYTKTKGNPTIYMTFLDVNEVSASGKATIDPAVKAELPDFVQRHLKQEKWTFEHGTVVVWDRPDRLTYKSGGALRGHLMDDFGVVYRYLLKDVELNVDGTKVNMVDPLFLDPKGLFYKSPDEGGAQCQIDRSIPVRYFNDPESGVAKLKRIEPDEEIDKDDPNLLAIGAVHVRLSRFPLGFVQFTRSKKTVESDENRRAEIRKLHAGMSFVRANREIETISSFPKTQRDKSAGLGDWPMLQGYAYHVGIEVRFQPELDEVFGITNDKQTVRPVEEFWRLMKAEEMDRLVSSEYRWQVKVREEAEKEKKKKEAQRSETSTPAETAAATADQVQGIVPKVPEFLKPMVKARAKVEVERRAGITNRSVEEAEAAMVQEAKFRPYVIDYFDDVNGPFFQPEWSGPQVVIKINRKHPFFDTLYVEAMKLEDGDKVRQAIDVLLITLGRAELTVENETTQEWYRAQRVGVWSPFLKDSMRVLGRTLGDDLEELIDEGEQASA